MTPTAAGDVIGRLDLALEYGLASEKDGHGSGSPFPASAREHVQRDGVRLRHGGVPRGGDGGDGFGDADQPALDIGLRGGGSAGRVRHDGRDDVQGVAVVREIAGKPMVVAPMAVRTSLAASAIMQIVGGAGYERGEPRGVVGGGRAFDGGVGPILRRNDIGGRLVPPGTSARSGR